MPRHRPDGGTARASREQIGDASVEAASRAAEEPGIRGVVNERVREPPGSRSIGGGHERRLREARVDLGRDGLAVDLGNDRLPERHPDHGRHPQDRPGLLGQSVDPATEQRPEGHRHAAAAGLVAELEAAGRRGRRAFDRRPDRLGDEQGVAGGPLVEPTGIGRVDVGSGDGGGEPAGLGEVEPIQNDPLDAVERRRSRRGPGSRAEDEHEGTGGRAPDDLVDHPGTRRIEPVDVVDEQDARAVDLDEAVHVAGRELAECARDLRRLDQHERRLRLPARERGVASDRGDGPGPQPRPVRWRIVREQEPPGHRTRVRAVLVGDRLGQRSAEAVRLAGTVRDVVDPRAAEAGIRCVGREVRHEARLAHAGLALDDDGRAAVRPHRGQDRPEAGPFGVAADDRPDRRRPPGLEAGFAEEAGDPDRARLAAQELRPAILDLEALPGRAKGRLVEEDLAGLGNALNAGGRRYRRPGQGPVQLVVAAWRGHHFAGREADPDLEWLADGRLRDP